MVPGRTFLIGGGFLLFRGGRALQRGSLGKLDKPNLFIYALITEPPVSGSRRYHRNPRDPKARDLSEPFYLKASAFEVEAQSFQIHGPGPDLLNRGGFPAIPGGPGPAKG